MYQTITCQQHTFTKCLFIGLKVLEHLQGLFNSPPHDNYIIGLDFGVKKVNENYPLREGGSWRMETLSIHTKEVVAFMEDCLKSQYYTLRWRLMKTVRNRNQDVFGFRFPYRGTFLKKEVLLVTAE